MKVLNFFIVLLGKTLSLILERMNKGSSFPGRIALKLNKNILSQLSNKYKCIIVTGTNGKTTTTAMIHGILEKSGYSAITNEKGANMTTGIVTCFIDNYNRGEYAILEVDEAYVGEIAKAVKPYAYVVTNIFKDQTDRFSQHIKLWGQVAQAISSTPSATVILNADLELLSSVPFSNKTLYYGFSKGYSDVLKEGAFCSVCKQPLKFDYITFNCLGKYHCQCGNSRNALDYSVEDITQIDAHGSTFLVNGKEVSVGIPGIFNVYNALSAYALCSELGVPHQSIQEALKLQVAKPGRTEQVELDGRTINLMLVQNAAGCDECLKTAALMDKPFGVVFLINDNWSDGTDVSWLYDVDFELLARRAEYCYVGGRRRYDMAIRLSTCGYANFQIIDKISDLKEHLLQCPMEVLYIFATYSAMREVNLN